jgi:glycosyltransferase involved in cell wall biosynthesis
MDASGNAPQRPDIEQLLIPESKRNFFTKLSDKKNRKRRKLFDGSHTYNSWPEGWGDARLFSKRAVPDIYHLHWVAGFLDWGSALPLLTKQAPVIWTLHDLNPLQGIWHYDPDPDEINAKRNEIDIMARKIKTSTFSEIDKEKLVFVAPSLWMAKCCKEGNLTKNFSVEHIPYGIDTEIFYPIDKYAAKISLGIPSDTILIGFLADQIDDKRKGIDILQEAIKYLSPHLSLMLVTIGNGKIEIPISRKALHLGSVQVDSLLRLFYSACDIFVCPSLQDNLPNTILEAMACGTAVVGSAVGGIPDMVTEGETGWLASPGDAKSLAEALEKGLSNTQNLTNAGNNSRNRIVKDFNLRLQAERYIALYQRILDNTYKPGEQLGNHSR